jgi:hypothetical protein
VELLESYGVDLIKADCMMCQPCYTREVEMFSAAVAKVNRSIVPAPPTPPSQTLGP